MFKRERNFFVFLPENRGILLSEAGPASLNRRKKPKTPVRGENYPPTNFFGLARGIKKVSLNF